MSWILLCEKKLRLRKPHIPNQELLLSRTFKTQESQILFTIRPMCYEEPCTIFRTFVCFVTYTSYPLCLPLAGSDKIFKDTIKLISLNEIPKAPPVNSTTKGDKIGKTRHPCRLPQTATVAAVEDPAVLAKANTWYQGAERLELCQGVDWIGSGL
jgi:hypothetical protein